MVANKPGSAEAQVEIDTLVQQVLAKMRAGAEERMRAAMEAGTYIAPESAPVQRATRSEDARDWRRRQHQVWPSGCADRFGGRAVFGIGWKS